jgi:transposase
MRRYLTSQERDNLKIQHRQERDKRVCDRIKAVLLADDGWDYKQIACVLLISDESVKQHVQNYLDVRRLKPENGGSFSKLNEAASKELIAHLQNHTYLYTKDIVAYIKARFGVSYSIY